MPVSVHIKYWDPARAGPQSLNIWRDKQTGKLVGAGGEGKEKILNPDPLITNQMLLTS